MNARVWVCTRDPVFGALSLPLHPYVILLVIFAALTFRAHGRYAADELASQLWRALLKTTIGLCGFFLFWTCLVRFAFQMGPALVLNAVPYVWSVAGWLTAWLVWRRWRSGAVEPRRRSPGFMGVRWLRRSTIASIWMPFRPGTTPATTAAFMVPVPSTTFSPARNTGSPFCYRRLVGSAEHSRYCMRGRLVLPRGIAVKQRGFSPAFASVAKR
jgi:hypothetical protein